VNRRLAVLALAFTLTGCGGGDNESSASEDYANRVCGQLSSWIADQQATLKSVEDAGPSISREDLRAAVVHVRDSSQVLFLVDLEQLDVPESDAGDQAKTELDNFEMKLAQELGMVVRALDANTGVVALASMLATALATATNDVKSTLDELQNLDSDELKDAFQDSDECKMLRDEVGSIGSGS
jgi:hypothetical protein